MAGDVSEHIYSEKQLYTGDVVGEDDEDVNPLGNPRCALPELVDSAAGNGHGSPSAKPQSSARAAAVAPQPAVLEKGTAKSSSSSPAQEKRRKRAAERAQKVWYWLDTRYDILHQVCSSFEIWKEARSASDDVDLLWCDVAISADRFMKLKSYQKMNHFVGMSSITRKNNLGRNLLRMRRQFPKEYKFFPDTWILPCDLSDFKQQFPAGKGKTFIIKPDNGCQGRGIFLVRDLEKVPVDFSVTYVAQRYIQKPFLLDGFKFDLRLYVLVLGCDPLRIFLHRRGLVRCASEPYVEPTSKKLASPMVHLTNYAINKANPNFEENTNPEDAQDGHKRSWSAVHEFLRKEGYDVDTLFVEIEDLIVKTLMAVQPNLSHFYHSCQPDDMSNGMCFEVLGFDVMLDSKLQPWLLEVNHAPSFATESELDRLVKEEVLRDTFVLNNFSPEVRRQKKREAREVMEQRAMGAFKKQSMEERMAQEKQIAIERTRWEDEHLGGFKRLYPSEEMERKYMHIHEAAVNIWEMLMGGTSRRCVRLTEHPEEEQQQQQQPTRHAEAKPSRKATLNGLSNTGPNPPTEASPVKRTPEELREVVERLAAGNSARPRATVRRRGSDKNPKDSGGAPASDPDQVATTPARRNQELEAIRAPEQQLQPQAKQERMVRMKVADVQVGDTIKVQTNLGWEPALVTVKRVNGKLDIEFKDGEVMRSVIPRILKEESPAGTAAVENPSVNIESVARWHTFMPPK